MKLLILDTNNLLCRAYFGTDELSNSEGIPTNGLYSFIRMLINLIDEHKPTHIVAAKESLSSKRKELYPGYKANRGPAQPNLTIQFKLAREFLDLYNILQISSDGYEADDVIGSIATQWNSFFEETAIISSDKDLMQFISDRQNVYMLDTLKNIKYNEAQVFSKFGVRADQISHYLAICGDSSDNIPGIAGIGKKGAITLLQQAQTLTKAIECPDLIITPTLKKKFLNDLDNAILSKKLAEIATHLYIGKPQQAEYKDHRSQELFNFLLKYELYSLQDRFIWN